MSNTADSGAYHYKLASRPMCQIYQTAEIINWIRKALITALKMHPEEISVSMFSHWAKCNTTVFETFLEGNDSMIQDDTDPNTLDKINTKLIYLTKNALGTTFYNLMKFCAGFQFTTLSGELAWYMIKIVEGENKLTKLIAIDNIV